MKKVFSNHHEICHVWAAETQSEGRTKSMFFENENIYSYGHHFLAAKIYTNKKGEKFVLINSESYGPTTSKHLCRIRSAVSHLPSAHVESVDNPEMAVLELENDIIEKFFSFFRKQADRNGIDWALDYFLNDIKKYWTFCEFFNLKPAFKRKDAALYINLLKEKSAFSKLRYKELNTPEMIEKRERESERREARKTEKEKQDNLEKLENFRKTGRAFSHYGCKYLFISENEIITSGGARVPLVAGLKLLERVRKSSTENGEKIGHYTFDRIKEGKVFIGCHCINISEAEKVLGKLLDVYIEARESDFISPNFIAEFFYTREVQLTSGQVVAISNSL